MIFLGIALLLLGLVLAEPASSAMAHAAWPQRAPAAALLLWQFMGLVAGSAFLGAGVALSLAASSWLAVVAWLITLALAVRLLGVLIIVGMRTLRSRSRHRQLLDLIATPWPDRPGAAVLDHPTPVAYCLPGMRSRLVVSRGALDALTGPQLEAVLAHEQAHLAERHDLVVLPFVAWGETFPWLPGVLRSQLAVAELIEIRADDVAAAACGAANLALALAAVSGSPSPTLGSGPDAEPVSAAAGANVFRSAVQRRAQRVLERSGR